MKFMVIETFKPGRADDVYQRFQKKGRMLPDGLVYLDSWLSTDRSTCFQLMEAPDEKLFDPWISNWNDLVDFDIIPVNDSPIRRLPDHETSKGHDDKEKSSP